MSMEKQDVAGAQDEGLTSQTPKCACRSRKRCWILTILLLVILAGGAGAYWALFARIYALDVYKSAMQKIVADKHVQEALGQPVETIRWSLPSARIESGEIEIRWNVKGPKAAGKAHVHAKLMMDKWQTPILEVLLPGGKKIAVQDAGDGEAEAPVFQGGAPKFDGSKSEAKKPDNNAPPPDLNMQVPTMDGPGAK